MENKDMETQMKENAANITESPRMIIAAPPSYMRNCLVVVLKTFPDVCLESPVDDEQALLTKISHNSPALILIDAEDIGAETESLFNIIKTEAPATKTIVIAKDRDAYKRAQSLGADCVLLKGYPTEDLSTAIRELMQFNAGASGTVSPTDKYTEESDPQPHQNHREVSEPHILVVDDDQNFAKTLANILRLKGYDTLVASSGRDALRHTASKPFDCVLSDIRMDNMNGIELCRELSTQNPGLPVVLMTAYADDLLQDFDAENAAITILPKPLHFDALFELLQMYCKG
ncbi:MAG: response regulator [Anaerolineales bacterium]|nr:MAG: response regulator [Anaerolineales bacterium]